MARKIVDEYEWNVVSEYTFSDGCKGLHGNDKDQRAADAESSPSSSSEADEDGVFQGSCHSPGYMTTATKAWTGTNGYCIAERSAGKQVPLPT